jgi:rRNA maturation RNase YbeY
LAKHRLRINTRVTLKPPVALLEKVLVATLAQYGGKFNRRPTETSLVFITDKSMAQLNKMYRGKRGTTNVLSFSFVRPPNKIGAGEPLLLGEILISPKEAGKGARIHKHPLATEIALLFLHGLLHVLSFDHETGSRDQKAMQEAEDAVIAKIPALKKASHGQGLILRELVYPN